MQLTDGHILTIIQQQEIREQSDLQTILHEKGFDIPQATLSRRLRKLNIHKINGVYKILENAPSSLPYVTNLHITDSNLIVMHTEPGNANRLAYFIDHKYVDFKNHGNQKNTCIIGTIAGDDTVFIAINRKENMKIALQSLQLDFPYLVLP